MTFFYLGAVINIFAKAKECKAHNLYLELDCIQLYNMKYDICTCNILRDIAHNEMIINYVSQHCN